MKSKFLFALILICQSIFSQVGINTLTPDSSAELDVTSDSRGLLVPRLTTANITTLSGTAAEGLIVYDKDLKIFKGWNGTKWQNLSFELGTDTGVIQEQTFETASVVNYTTSGSPVSFSFRSGNSGAGDAPASSPLFSEGLRGYGYSNATATNSYIEFSIVDASSYSNNITLSFDVAAFSNGNTTNGMENTDFVTIDVSTDGGTNYTTKLTLLGGNSNATPIANARWAFSGTGIGTNAYSSSNLNVTSPNTTTTNPNTYTGTDAITKLSVTGIPNSSQLRIRIGVRTNSANELWVIDNVKLVAL